MKQYSLVVACNNAKMGIITGNSPIHAMRRIFDNVKRSKTPSSARYIVFDSQGRQYYYVADRRRRSR